MRLTEYLIQHELSPERFAARLGVNPSTIYRWLSGDTIPDRKNLKKIIAASGGEVDIQDLMLPALQAKPSDAQTKETAA